MRCSCGEEIELVNGHGRLAHGKVERVTKRSAEVSILSSVYTPAPLPRCLLALPFLRPTQLEWVVEKATELGASAFLLYRARRSERQSLSSSQRERLRAVAIAALKQSGRLYVPSFELFSDLASLWRGTPCAYLGIFARKRF